MDDNSIRVSNDETLSSQTIFGSVDDLSDDGQTEVVVMEESNEETTEQSNDEPTPAEEEEMPESPQDSPFLFPNATIQDSLNDASLNSQTPSSSPNSDLFSLSVGTPLSSVSFSHVV